MRTFSQYKTQDTSTNPKRPPKKVCEDFNFFSACTKNSFAFFSWGVSGARGPLLLWGGGSLEASGVGGLAAGGPLLLWGGGSLEASGVGGLAAGGPLLLWGGGSLEASGVGGLAAGGGLASLGLCTGDCSVGCGVLVFVSAVDSSSVDNGVLCSPFSAILAKIFDKSRHYSTCSVSMRS